MRSDSGAIDDDRQVVVVVGHGIVAHRFFEEMAERGALARYRLIVFGGEKRAAYDNAVDYDAHHHLVDASVKVKSVGAVGAGYEVLGTDNGRARVVTPFSTAHKFNRFADVFLNNGGVRRLRDVYAYFAASLVSIYKVNEFWSFLYEFGYFDGGKNRSPLSTRRRILQTTLKF